MKKLWSKNENWTLKFFVVEKFGFILKTCFLIFYD